MRRGRWCGTSVGARPNRGGRNEAAQPRKTHRKGRGLNETRHLPEDFANAYEAAFVRLQIRVETACAAEAGWPVGVAAAIRATLAFAAADPDAAYVLTSGALTHGKAGFARYDRMLDHFAEGLLPGRAERPGCEHLPDITEKAMIGGLATMISNRVDSGRAAELPAIGFEAIQFVLTPYLGAEDARRIGLEGAR